MLTVKLDQSGLDLIKQYQVWMHNALGEYGIDSNIHNINISDIFFLIMLFLFYFFVLIFRLKKLYRFYQNS